MTQNIKIIILDGYTDEPSILGVPPYIAPIVRYAFGATLDLGIHSKYYTIDQARKSQNIKDEISSVDFLVIIAGALLPGKYLRGSPISYKEIQYYSNLGAKINILGGSVSNGYYNKGTKQFYPSEFFSQSFDYIVKGDLDAFIYDLLKMKLSQKENRRNENESEIASVFRKRTQEELNNWSVIGASVVKQHPDCKIGYIIADIDIYSGCVRYITGGCSFCIEPSRGKPIFREQVKIAEEIAALSKNGVENFRLGGASCIFSYKTKELGFCDSPKPNVDAITELFVEIKKAAPNLKVLHTDNANPAIIADHVEESKKIIDILLKYCTGGNIISFGIESVDESVRLANNLNSTKEQCEKAIRIVNESGGKERSLSGMPKLLPGLNFLYGLKGETKSTYSQNYDFLEKILNDNLFLRRINLRQVLDFKQDKEPKKFKSKHLKWFYGHKQKVLNNIENSMLKRVIPTGTILKNLFVELYKDDMSFARQIGSYPITVKIPEKLTFNEKVDALVISHNKKSINALTIPIKFNELSLKAIKMIPEIGQKRADTIMQNFPIKNEKHLVELLNFRPIILESLHEYIEFSI